MPYVETPADLADAIADLVGIYGGGPLDGSDHPDECPCRICFTEMIERRIWNAVENGARLGVTVPSE